ncbi:MAG: IS1182 family transposase [Candidatus Omnitrophota bacterium]|nr:IS1182 family transposase [Candidatus Omnitrophota bacterium]
MAYRYGDRNQLALFPPSVEDYVPKDATVRAYDAMVDALDFKELGIDIAPDNVGNSQYDPKTMLKLHVYGMAYGVRSSRKLEREAHYNISFIWLMGQLKPDHKTIAEFRRKNKKALQNVLKQCAKMCIKLGLIEGNTLFADGSKIRANASIKNKWTKGRCEEVLKKADENIDRILKECEDTDLQEEDQPSLIKMQKELSDHNALKSKVNDILKELKGEQKKQHNTTDPDCAVMNSQKGTFSGYNVQIVVDEKHSLIVTSDAVNDNSDLKQFSTQIKNANETLGAPCKVACADSGYAAADELAKVDAENIKVVVPSQRQASRKEQGQFEPSCFRFDQKNRAYICPEGHILKFQYSDKKKRRDRYGITDAKICLKCSHFGQCTNNKQGRRVHWLWNEEARLKFEKQYLEPDSQAIYKLRQQKVEHPIGHIKRNLKFDSFLLKGRDGVKAEISLAGACFNIARMITIFGVTGLIQKMQG